MAIVFVIVVAIVIVIIIVIYICHYRHYTCNDHRPDLRQTGIERAKLWCCPEKTPVSLAFFWDICHVLYASALKKCLWYLNVLCVFFYPKIFHFRNWLLISGGIWVLRYLSDDQIWFHPTVLSNWEPHSSDAFACNLVPSFGPPTCVLTQLHSKANCCFNFDSSRTWDASWDREAT